MGKVYLVGAGCGTTELITLKGLTLLSSCEVLLYDALTDPAYLQLVPADCERICVGKRYGERSIPQEEVHRLLIQKAKTHRLVVRLKGGDPYLFGRGGEEMLALKRAGIECEEVPGISSALAVPAAAGIPVTHRGVSRTVTILTASAADSAAERGEELAGLNYEALAALKGTLVILMGLHHLEELAARLLEAGMRPDLPAAVIMKGTLPAQRTVRGTLQDIASRVRKEHITAPAVIVFGEVAAFRLAETGEGCPDGRPLLHLNSGLLSAAADKTGETQTSLPSLPLRGIRIGVTGTADFAGRMGEILKDTGAQVLDLSFLQVIPCPWTLPEADACDWLVFTSPNGVDVFMKRLFADRRDLRTLSRTRFAVIGPGTARRLAAYGIYADLVPERYDSRSLGESLASRSAPGERIVLCRAKGASGELPEALKRAGREYRELVLYTLAVEESRCRRALKTLGGQQSPVEQASNGAFGQDVTLSYLIFGSAGGVRTFFEQADPGLPGRLHAAGCKAVCIGACCALALRGVWPGDTLVAESASLSSIAEAIVQDVSGREKL